MKIFRNFRGGLSENLSNEKISPTDNRKTEVNYQCSSHFGIKNGMESHGAVVFGRSGGYMLAIIIQEILKLKRYVISIRL